MKKISVIDFFCGAGGFSEGFRQQGFDIVMGVDNWSPAIETFNYNFNLNCKVKNILDFERSLEEIESLPDTDVIIGSPPCVSFSNSNRSGKADKSLGLRLTESFLRIVVVKKFKSNSVLKAWFMENVKNSSKYLKDYYTFQDLDLSSWALNNGYAPKQKVINIKNNGVIVNSAEYGSPQNRKRLIIGELIDEKKLILPVKTHKVPKDNKSELPFALSLGEIKNKLPRPNSKKSYRKIKDPMYPNVEISMNRLTDHFYDSGLYSSQWKHSEYMKRNHPYMGRMSFPEKETNPSRTITATNIGTSREAIIYKSEYKRKGDGEYRIPTVREMASLMGFPITYQFLGRSEYSKCRLVGNAVCPTISRLFAEIVRKKLGHKSVKKISIHYKDIPDQFHNLNTFSEKKFNTPPKKNKGARFRRHPFKYGNITVTLSNYDINKKSKTNKWRTSVQYGNGDGFPSDNFQDNYYKRIEKVILNFKDGNRFLEIINNGFSEKISHKDKLQELLENQYSEGDLLEPSELIEEVARIINEFSFEDENYLQAEIKIFKRKKKVPKKQVLALYAINKITSLTNKLPYEQTKKN